MTTHTPIFTTIANDGSRWVSEEDYLALIDRYADALSRLTQADDGWRDIASAPRNSEHILGMQAGSSFGHHNFKRLPEVQTVVHWWDKPGEEGFYTSVNETEPSRPFPATHWKPLTFHEFNPPSIGEAL